MLSLELSVCESPSSELSETIRLPLRNLLLDLNACERLSLLVGRFEPALLDLSLFLFSEFDEFEAEGESCRLEDSELRFAIVLDLDLCFLVELESFDRCPSCSRLELADLCLTKGRDFDVSECLLEDVASLDSGRGFRRLFPFRDFPESVVAFPSND